MHDASVSNDRTSYSVYLDEGHHQCVRWSTTDIPAKDRSLDVIEPEVVVYTILGKSHEWFHCHLI